MKTALEAQIWNEKRWNDKTPTVDNKVEGRVVSEPIRGIIHPITLTITATTVAEAIKLHRMGYLSKEALAEAGVDVPAPSNEAKKKEIQHAIREHFGYSAEQLAVKCRKRELVLPRQFSMFLMEKFTSYIQKDIAAMYNKSDHTTVIHARDTIIDHLTFIGSSYEKTTLNDFLNKYSFE